MIAGPFWLQRVLLALAVVALLVGGYEIVQLMQGRRRTAPGYGWETEVTHLLMNGLMAAMVTSWWSAAAAHAGAILLGSSTLLLAIIPACRAVPTKERSLIVAAGAIHIGAALLMAWLMLRMAPSAMHGMAMARSRRPWPEWMAASFFLFDLVSVLIVTAVPHRFSRKFRTGSPRLSIFPHVAMDAGMIAMLVAM